ncbi:KinB-signaling pathway activation protein [Paenibacillus sp. IHBB 10380]|uniref:KinB-signaling pathway activation protein n=1 Tax=Paenibacillus sp. IHBB 10380 TaxID=1566358 RepID=UPI0005CF968C|nr:KinB-signaling pathway activation protein [Paenibacillus sp. IHBB 10380]AJS60243.1 KinB signaling pathway activation protein [Paenibacillus sp. IHBB 10380]
MSLRKWFNLFWKTLLIGSAASLVMGVLLQFGTGAIIFKGSADYIVYFVILFGYGLLASVYSQMGFFAYLILNYMANGIFSRKVWQYIQMVLTVLALLELLFFRRIVGGQSDRWSDLVLGLSILVVSIGVAYFKAKWTNLSAWIPTLFFMIAITIVETVGGLKIGVNNATAFIVIPLIACNAYQILILHRVVQNKKS